MIGTTLSHYKILDELGRGGMGIVYKAEDTKLDRVVALKVLPFGSLATDNDRERFLREARAAAKLHHPNIATIYEIGDGQAEGATSPQPYIAMEFVAGRALSDRIADGPAPEDEAVAVGRQIAQALEAAHGAGVIHRDIKSGNVMLTEAGVAKVLDFGLAKVGDDPAITKEGSTIGTMAYMSPEQARGEVVDARSDLWSLGVILYEMLEGNRPFTGAYDSAVLYSLLNEDPAPLTVGASPAVQDLILDLLKKDPSSRPSSAGEVLSRLGGPVPSASMIEGGRKRSPVVTVALGGAVLALAAVTVIGVIRSRSKAEIRSEVLPRLDSLLSAVTFDASATDTWAAFTLAQRATEALPDDPYVDDLSARATGVLWVEADAQPVSLFIRSDSAASIRWIQLPGTAAQPVPRGFHELRVSAAGYDEFELLVSISDTTRLAVDLQETGTVPEEMVRVDSTDARLRMPYLDHLPGRNVPAFLLDRYETTNEEYMAFVDDGGYSDRSFWLPSAPDPAGTFVDQTGRPGPATWSLGRFVEGEENYPVRGVSWYEADAFARWKGRQLPTVYHFNAAASFFAAAYVLPNANIDSPDGPLPVGASGSMTGPGIYDLAGNVREWVANANRRDSRRFILGGAWSDPPYSFQDAYTLDPMDRGPANGFRTMSELEEDGSGLTDDFELPFRDFATEQPIGAAMVDQFQGYFTYDQAPLDAVVVSADSSDTDYIVERVSYDAGYGNERVTAWMFIPTRTSPPYQAVVYFPGDWAFGDDQPMPDLPPARDWWEFVARDGRAMIIPVYRNQYDRGSELASSTPNESVVYRDHMVMWSKEVSRSVDYLIDRGDVDPDAIAFVGFSWGSRVSPVMLYNEPRFRTAVLLVGGLRFQRSRPEVDPFNYLRHVTLPVLMLNGRYDFYFPYETSQIPFFEHLGTPSADKRMIVYETSHSLPGNERIRETLAWLDKYLGPVRE